MEDTQKWIDYFTEKLVEAFPDNISCIGLQGSYGRGEATAESDIDLVVIFKKCACSDLLLYKKMVQQYGEGRKICGFVGGADILAAWNKAELLQLYFDTVPLYGNLDFIKSKISLQAAGQLILQNSCTVYHGCCHNFLFDEDDNLLHDLYKTAVFTVQAKYYFRKQVYIKKHGDLRIMAEAQDKEILAIAAAIKESDKLNREQFVKYSTSLLKWSSQNILEFGSYK